ncbi:23S rRNA (uracil(1939)-C(5))-methyltransferase RlmD [Paenibacillus aquistagni]|uniref:23S rRNA (uracil(1939)-C(5))-methyltransferase RlmD n=1 Tax=Paenibacillus aquistagni TaxID=1852522 RepID=UPI000B51176F|nr:23S rRNA (uracil(1939)-C(5))-methyltransferase RlmD [Paenibacillus aquistagni]
MKDRRSRKYKQGGQRSGRAGQDSRKKQSTAVEGIGVRQVGQGTGSRSTSKKVLTAPVQKNDQVELEIIGLTHDGEGVGRVEGFTLFVQGALPGETVRAHVLKVKKQYGYAKMIERLQNSPHRVDIEHPAHYYGGCQLQHLAYGEQLRWKRQHVVDVLERIGKFEVAQEDEGASEGLTLEEHDSFAGDHTSSSSDSEAAEKPEAELDGKHSIAEGTVISTQDSSRGVSIHDEADNTDEDKCEKSGYAIKVHPTIGMDNPWRYRNKSQMPIGADDKTGELIGGYYVKASHRIIDTDVSLIQHEMHDEAMRVVKQVVRKYGIIPYDEESHHGLLRHVIMRVGFRTKELMVVLVTNGDKLPYQTEIVNELVQALPNLKSICQNVNTKRTNVIMGDKTRVLWGEEYITDYIGDIEFKISARSFYQVNPVQTEVLYDKAVEYAGLTGEETVIDAYCGIGTISLFLAKKAKRVYGVEIVEEAIQDARRNAELNGIEHVEFAVGAAEVVIPQWKEQGIEADVIVVDPPRKGCDPALLDTMLAMRPERIVYVSCNPSTLARDLRILADGGYAVKEVQPVDMFPHTSHVECTVLLKLRGAND